MPVKILKQVVLGPTFEIETPMGVEAGSDWLDEALIGHRGALVCRRTGAHFLVSIDPSRRHFWSPWMTFELVADGSGGSRGHGRFNPSPGIWTGFILAALAMITVAGSGLVWATAEWTLGRPLHGLWGTLVGTVGVVVLFLVSASGQRLAKAEMEEIERVVREAVGDQSAGG